MAEWVQGSTGLWLLAEGDVTLKPPQAAPDDDGLPRRYSAGFAPDNAGLDASIQRAMELLGQIEGDPMRRANGGPGLVGLGLGPNDLFNGGSLDPCQWLEWLRNNFPGGMPGWLSCKTFKWILLAICFVVVLSASRRR